MTNHDNSSFWRWLCDELADEARQARRSAGRIPPKPVCLSELEAIGLLLLASVIQHRERAEAGAACAARTLVDTLRRRLEQVSSNLRDGHAT